MLDKEIISAIRDFAYNNYEKEDIHGYPHVERVYNTCIQIGLESNANLLVLKIASLFHDIGRINKKKYDLYKNHGEISAEIALNFLKSANFKLAKADVDNIIHCIKVHSFSSKLIPQTLEAKILSDADKLDAIGAIGLYRTIGFTVKNNGGLDQVIEHLENKIIKLKDLLYLDISKELAEERQSIVLDFFNKIKKEREFS
ncbi:MAG: HD domain-containing protein [Promethearchaeota archaeon]